MVSLSCDIERERERKICPLGKAMNENREGPSKQYIDPYIYADKFWIFYLFIHEMLVLMVYMCNSYVGVLISKLFIIEIDKFIVH